MTVSSTTTATTRADDDGTTKSATDSAMLGKDDFLKLLVSQLQHQDPMNPVDDKDFMGQMAQFTSVEQLTNMATSIDRMSTASQSTQSIALIGKTVSWKKEDGSIGRRRRRRRCRSTDGAITHRRGRPTRSPRTRSRR